MKLLIMVRDLGKLSPDYSVEVDAPAVPQIGSYLSIHRPDKPYGHTEDLIVRQVWWRFHYPHTGAIAPTPPKVGTTEEIVVECDVAEGPNSTDNWLMLINGARSRGVEVPKFEVARVTVRESQLSGSDPA